MAGVIAAQRTQMTRRGKMSFVTLDDGTARVDVAIYRELHEASRRQLRDDELLVVLGKVQKDDYTGGQRVTAERVLDLAAARQEFGRRLLIRLNGHAEADALRSAIAPFAAGSASAPGGGQGISSSGEPARLPVRIEYGNAQARCAIELGEAWRVRPEDDLIVAIGERLRPLAVSIEY
jgi:DNA polymerase-3 subunit alpha